MKNEIPFSQKLKDEIKKRGIQQARASTEIGIGYQTLKIVLYGGRVAESTMDKIREWLKK